MRKTYRRYDPRLRNLVAVSDDLSKFANLGIPKSTLKQWKRNGVKNFITIPEFELSAEKLVEENIRINAELAAARAEQDLLVTIIRIFGFQIQYKRLPSSEAKSDIIAAIKKAVESIPLQTCLVTIGLSAARYHSWVKRQVNCLLKDQISCPKASPTRLTFSEVSKIKELFTNPDFAHYSIYSLTWLGKKSGEVNASSSTWSRVGKQYGLDRRLRRIYPAKPKVGIRASYPGQIWHLDMIILRLQDGTRAYVQCIIDNYSRFVLAWHVSVNYGGVSTKSLLSKALSKAKELGLDMIPDVYVDSGSENINENVDQLISSNQIVRTIAQIDVEFSNSMIEMLFHRLKHRYLCTIPLTNFEALVKAVNFYLNQSNTLIPQMVLKGATPEEVITGNWGDDKIIYFKEKMDQARRARIIKNTSECCTPCLA